LVGPFSNNIRLHPDKDIYISHEVEEMQEVKEDSVEINSNSNGDTEVDDIDDPYDNHHIKWDVTVLQHIHFSNKCSLYNLLLLLLLLPKTIYFDYGIHFNGNNIINEEENLQGSCPSTTQRCVPFAEYGP